MYKMNNKYRSAITSEINASYVGKEVRVAGHVQTIRDHGGITFVDLRDFYGVVQVVIHDLTKVPKFNKETVISVFGKIIKRAPEAVNPKMATGEVELIAESVDVLGPCEAQLPFEISESRNVAEDVRLKYRYLDLRNPEMHENMIMRSAIIAEMRRLMEGEGFMEIQTPILTSSSPEGARDYIVPSRLHPGMFYALPQAPQQFKQILMCSGIDRYFQIAPCFRDEDARADRCPGEFYQLDLEMAYATQEDVFAVMENVLPKIFEKFGKSKIAAVPFPRIPYLEAMEKYGSDKPDLRNPLVVTNLTETFKNSSFGAFRGNTVKAVCAPMGDSSRRFYDKIVDEMVELNGAKGLAWVKFDENMEMAGPLVKFLTEEEKKDIISKTGAKFGDAIFFVSDTPSKTTKLCGLLRTLLGTKLDLIEKDVYKFCWITDFPMYEKDEETGKIDFCHNPFSLPQGGMDDLLNKNPLDILAYQYDIIVNGVELSSGAVRNADPRVLLKAFEIAGYDEKTVEEKFSALYTAFKYGAPPHAGIAPGVDRMIMLLRNEPSIREVVPFPMNKKAQSLLMGAPSFVTPKQLREVHIKID